MLTVLLSGSCSTGRDWFWRHWAFETLTVCSCQNIHIERFVCSAGYVTPSIHHSPWSAVSRGEDGSSKLGPCGRIWLPLSCVWHRRWISVSPSPQTSEDPRSIWARDAFTLPPLRFMLCPLLGHCLTERVWGSVFSTIHLGGGSGGVCACVRRRCQFTALWKRCSYFSQRVTKFALFQLVT